MGQDCIVKINNRYYSLDRFYVFRSEFEFEEKYNKNEYINKIKKIKQNLYNLTTEYTDRQNKFIEYYKNWISILENLIKEHNPKFIMFYDHSNAPNEYYDRNYN